MTESVKVIEKQLAKLTEENEIMQRQIYCCTARKMTEIVWALLTEKQDFDSKKDDGKIQTYESCGSGFGCQ